MPTADWNEQIKEFVYLNNNFRKKTNIILGNHIKNYISTHIVIEIKWLVDFRKDPANVRQVTTDLLASTQTSPGPTRREAVCGKYAAVTQQVTYRKSTTIYLHKSID